MIVALQSGMCGRRNLESRLMAAQSRTAADIKNLAGNKAVVRMQEEHCSPGDVLGRAEPLDDNAVNDFLGAGCALRVAITEKLRGDGAGADGVDSEDRKSVV